MHTASDITIKNISKVEGRANLSVKLAGGKVEKVEFQIAEYKRFYTRAIRGKNINALPQMVSRICGTCSIAHLICSIKAIEKALEISPSPQTIRLRKLIMYGLVIRDHALHLYLFALPDYFGKDSILEFDEHNAKEHELLHDAFAVKKSGNILSSWIGGRAVHALYPKVGGFVKLPDMEQKKSVMDSLKGARKRVFALLQIFSKSPFEFSRKTHFAAITPDDFNFLEGPLKSTHGWNIEERKYREHLQHVVIPYSMSSGYTLDNQSYMVGALARININKKHLHEKTRRDTEEYLALFPSENIFLNNLAQTIEIIHAIDHSLELLKTLELQTESAPQFALKKTSGVGIIEAPRGLLFYQLDINENGVIEDGQIVVPTSQNQINIEQDVRYLVEQNMEKEKSEIELMLEMLIRAYDPCMSCASHFLKVRWEGK